MSSADDKQPAKPSSTPDEPPSRLAGATRNATFSEWWQAAKTIRPDDFRNIEQVPCARQSLMYGIAGGTAIGCTRYLTSNPRIASNWAVASFVLISAFSWRRCRSIQTSQMEQMRAVKEQLAEKARRRSAIRKERSTSAETSMEQAGP
ncbi:Cytochrome c oxidase protein 20, mitochondrial {ECO:0000256/PIRNR:PIRNR007871} [Serendipita indica DSM 11827]|uniref:Cytochrome c oxidase assembly protein COX20, mitochondrial n=1 Tax=Serendipita indica (strain DSM 11827) TaxID=1109443 RepID=G4TW90_SERID|nr:Cytochrome c oxidase protein 20, mitochondrial {ECO:0000256/PIRNR:PIRNR007871} [Serendipita indica DSM 11827]CCA75583.1 hypothetical protein PIIN_09573 [Serendipita indica DSM 11827]